MTVGINGLSTAGATDQLHETMNKTRPPSGSPAGAPSAAPDVEVAISQVAQARLDAMQAPAAEPSQGDPSWDAASGSMDFGVEKGGFDWPLNANQSSTASGTGFESQEGWSAAGDVVNGVLLDDANAANEIAMGDTSISDNA